MIESCVILSVYSDQRISQIIKLPMVSLPYDSVCVQLGNLFGLILIHFKDPQDAELPVRTLEIVKN